MLAAMPWPPPEMPSEEQFKQFQAMEKSEQLTPSLKPVPEVLAPTAPHEWSEAEVARGLELFKNAWFLGPRAAEDQQFEVDTFHLPPMAKVTAAWLAGGAIKGEAAKLLEHGSGQIALAADADVNEAKAKVTVDVPAEIVESVAACGGPSTPPLGRLACNNDWFQVDVDGMDDADLITPLNADQKPLATTGEQTRISLFSGDRTLDAISYDDFKKGPSTKERVSCKARGVVAFVRLGHVKTTKKHELDVVAMHETKQEEFSASSRPRYLRPADSEPTYGALTTVPLQLVSGRSCAAFTYNAPQIALVLPPVDNSQLAKPVLSRPQVAGKFELVENGLEGRRYLWTLEAKKPPVFASLHATAKVQYPTQIEAVSLPASAIHGSQVEVPVSVGELITAPSRLPASFQGLCAFAANGLPLKPFSSASGSDETMTYSFMGQVASAKLWVVRHWENKTVKAVLKPAPLRPKGREGICEE